MPQVPNERLKGRNGEVWQHYLRGHTQEAIAARFELDQTTVSKIVREVRSTIADTDAAELRRLNLERLDAMLPGSMALAEAGDKDAVKSVLAIMERQAKYLGLDAPTKQEVSAGLRYVIEGLE